MERNPWFRALIILLAMIAALYLLQVLWAAAMAFADIIMLFFMAWLVAFVLEPLVNCLVARLSFPRLLAVASVYLGLLVVIIVAGIVIVPVIGFQLAQLGAMLPKSVEELPNLVNLLQEELWARGANVQLAQWYEAQDIPKEIQKMATLAIQNLLSLLTSVASALFATLVVFMLSFYISLDGNSLAGHVVGLVPERYQDEVRYLFESIDRSFGGFLRGQVIQAVIYGSGTGLIMWVAGLNYVLLATTFSGVLMIIPFFGPFLAMIPPLIIVAFQGSVSQMIAVLIALLILQQIVLNVLAPKVMSDALGMHPLLVFMAILVGGKIAGLAGAVFGVPVVAVINAMALYFIRRSWASRRTIEGDGVRAPAHASDSLESWRSRITGLRGTINRLIVKDS